MREGWRRGLKALGGGVKGQPLACAGSPAGGFAVAAFAEAGGGIAAGASTGSASPRAAGAPSGGLLGSSGCSARGLTHADGAGAA